VAIATDAEVPQARVPLVDLNDVGAVAVQVMANAAIRSA
jgi:uncharacterized Ntn-hydrolase superfamily protein